MSRSSRLGVRGPWCAAASLAILGCGAARGSARAPGGSLADAPGAPGAIGLGTPGLRAPDDPTVWGVRGVRGAHLLPERLDEGQAWGTEPGGGVREIVGGVRLIVHPDGTAISGIGQLPGGPWREIEVPERLGGGVLFAAGSKLWRAPSWLGPLSLLAVASAPIEEVLVGLDRAYLRFGPGTLAALDPRDGSALALGPLPAAPWLASVSAQDAWHATAIADLRGVLVTEDAGSTWHLAQRPADPEGHVRAPSTTARPPSGTEGPKLDGAEALRLAVTDGWPLADGTGLVARDGALMRIRLADGFIVEEVANAFPMNPARCHPFSLATARDRGAFGYTCGEPRGPTRIYVWSADASRLVEARRFAEPRQVDAFGNGALAVRGSCEEVGAAETAGDASLWCAMSPRGAWSERIVRGAGAHLVVLSDGRTAVLHTPVDGNLTTASIATTEGSRETTEPVSFGAMANDESHVLRLGVWMDGFEERRPGWIGGWVDLAGSILGIEISLRGETRVGESIRDARGPVVGGRWGLLWPLSRRGFETTDGGMTWTQGIALPDPLPQRAAGQEHVCGPIGCLMEGWMRVGWGADSSTNLPEPEPLPRPRSLSAPPLRLTCEPTSSAANGHDSAIPVLRRGQAAEPVTHFPALWRHEGPAIPSGDAGLWADVPSDFDPQLRAVPFARAYAWGPRDEDWTGAAKWELLWMWPRGASPEVRASAAAPAQWSKLDAAQAAMRGLAGWQNGWTVIPGDDPDHALLVLRGTSGPSGPRVALLESGRAPAWIQSPAEFESVGAATRIGGQWYLATSQRPLEPQATVLWTLEGSTARELARLPRVALEGRRPVRLARRSDGRGIGIAVEGQPDVNGDASTWVVGVDTDSGEMSDPTELAPLASADLGVSTCTGDEPGWILELPYPGSVDVRIGERWGATLAGGGARLRLSASHACIEGVVGSTDREAASPPPELSQALGAPSHAQSALGSSSRALEVTVYCARQYFHLRCIPE